MAGPHGRITVRVVEYGTHTITVDRAGFDEARADGTLEEFLGLRGIRGDTQMFVTTPDGVTVNVDDPEDPAIPPFPRLTLQEDD